MMPEDWKALLSPMDAIYFGAVGWPMIVPDHISLWGSLLKFRREFDQYINLRPAQTFEGVRSPLAGRNAGDIDRQAHDAIVAAVKSVLASGPHAADLGDNASTTEMGEAIARRISEAA
jgi:isocitrate/isopropylmalate dehydrogenase